MPAREGYRLRVLDNFHLDDEDEEYETEHFPSLQAAEERARTMIDRFLVNALRPGMSAAELNEAWSLWGERRSCLPLMVFQSRCSVLCTTPERLRSG